MKVGEPLFAAVEEQAAAALARALLQIDPNINTGPHGNAAHVAVRCFGAGRTAGPTARSGGAEVEFHHRLDVLEEDETLVWCPHRAHGLLDNAMDLHRRHIWWGYRPRAAPLSETAADDAKQLAAVKAVFGDDWERWPAGRKLLWGLPDSAQTARLPSPAVANHPAAAATVAASPGDGPWLQVLTPAPWAPRDGMGALVLNGFVYLLGGCSHRP